MRLGMRDLPMVTNAARIYHLAGMNEKARVMLSKVSRYERCLTPAERADAAGLAVLAAANRK